MLTPDKVEWKTKGGRFVLRRVVMNPHLVESARSLSFFVTYEKSMGGTPIGEGNGPTKAVAEAIAHYEELIEHLKEICLSINSDDHKGIPKY